MLRNEPVQHAVLGVTPDLDRIIRSLFGDVKQHFENYDTAAADILSVELPPCRISRIRATAHCAIGERVASRSYDVDHIKVVLLISGWSRFRQGDVEETLSGGCMMYDPTQSYSYVNLTPIDEVFLQIPRTMFPKAFLGRLCRPMTIENSDTGMPHILSSIIRATASQMQSLDDLDRARLGETLTRLVFGTFVDSKPSMRADEAPLGVLRQRAKAFIESHLSAVDLSIEYIANRMGCSRRYIHKAFEEVNEAPERFIWECRLERSRLRLLSPEDARRSISEISSACGFSSSAHFSRAFKSRFQMSPREYRKLHH
jgi:AraC-like DNA-binding protein